MKSKVERIRKIRSFLRHQSGPQSITEIYGALINRLGLDVSRKTIERDVLQMEEEGLIRAHQGTPVRYYLNGPPEIDIRLTLEEVTILIKLLGPDSPISDKLRDHLSRET
jgi:DeoR/GlpR family transcriptional regulator of sugar metabolism